ncbi:RNA polymerase sigma factor [Pedobacter sp. MR2016-24]|uniref:RNA polymerase sigma factor n=1 Tax=Pedobacter sp. MR2016-24 TaxID=2994466 RepID=UPI0022457972|nr:sigma-70 family RNA polymerase sigma factor [Pedobacter sp. MR2016-24]MCX2483458.1 sigma-70 family RNA polymerase sigma factor [Pedobacter sp. MR2016-24]
MEKKDTFIKAIQENERLIFKVASFYTDSKDDRDDLVQDIIYNLWKSFDTFQQRSSFSTWMYRVAMNVAILHLKQRKRKVPAVPIDLGALNFAETGFDGNEEKLQVLRKLMNDLNLFDKGILMLYLEDKSHTEIAEIIGISKSNVGTKLSRIKQKLRQQVNNQNQKTAWN